MEEKDFRGTCSASFQSPQRHTQLKELSALMTNELALKGSVTAQIPHINTRLIYLGKPLVVGVYPINGSEKWSKLTSESFWEYMH